MGPNCGFVKLTQGCRGCKVGRMKNPDTGRCDICTKPFTRGQRLVVTNLLHLIHSTCHVQGADLRYVPTRWVVIRAPEKV